MAIVMAALTCALILSDAAQDPFGDTAVMIVFQRAADNYAFTHRQVERRRGTPAPAGEGALFTPPVAAAFRARVAIAIRRVGCKPPEPGISFVVPGVSTSASATLGLSSCIAAVLPPLPAELAYRTAGVALLLVDAHTGVVVDIVHAAFP